MLKNFFKRSCLVFLFAQITCVFSDVIKCPKTRGIYKSPEDCDENCNFLVQWTIDDQRVDFFMLSRNLLPWSGIRIFNNDDSKSDFVLVSKAFRAYPVRHAKVSSQDGLSYEKPSKRIRSQLRSTMDSIFYEFTRNLTILNSHSRCVRVEYLIKGAYLNQIQPNSDISNITDGTARFDEILCSQCEVEVPTTTEVVMTEMPTTMQSSTNMQDSTTMQVTTTVQNPIAIQDSTSVRVTTTVQSPTTQQEAFTTQPSIADVIVYEPKIDHRVEIPKLVVEVRKTNSTSKSVTSSKFRIQSSTVLKSTTRPTLDTEYRDSADDIGFKYLTNAGLHITDEAKNIRRSHLLIYLGIVVPLILLLMAAVAVVSLV